MRIFKSIVLFGALVACAASAAPGEPLKPLSFRAEAKVEVDANGKFVSASASEDLPEGVRRYIEQQLATWTYKRNDPNGTPHGVATTWVWLRACAMPTTAGTYAMGLAYEGSGPVLVSMGSLSEVTKVVGRHRLDGTVKMHLVLQPDGTVAFESVEGAPAQVQAELTKVLRNWVATFRSTQEMIDGKPVRSRQTMPLAFSQGSRHRTTHEELLAKALESPQCKQAGQLANTASLPLMQAEPADLLVAVTPSI